MFERRVEFDVAYVPWKDVDPDYAVRLVVAWWREQPGDHLVLFHAKNMLQNNNILAGLVRGARVESYSTVRRSSWSGGPVLAPWPSDKVLGALDDDLAPPSAVAIVEWGDRDGYVRSWLSSHHAQNLHTGEIAGASAELIPPVVRVAMEELSQQVNHNNGLVQAADQGRRHPDAAGSGSGWSSLRRRRLDRLGRGERVHDARGRKLARLWPARARRPIVPTALRPGLRTRTRHGRSVGTARRRRVEFAASI